MKRSANDKSGLKFKVLENVFEAYILITYASLKNTLSFRFGGRRRQSSLNVHLAVTCKFAHSVTVDVVNSQSSSRSSGETNIISRNEHEVIRLDKRNSK